MKETVFKKIRIKKCFGLLLLLSLFLVACNQPTDKTAINSETQNSTGIEGVWELTDFYFVKYGDTLYPEPESIGFQHRVYLDGYVMWTAAPQDDSIEWHGYGTYRHSNDTLIVKLQSMSLPLKAKMGSDEELIYKIEYDENSLKQERETMLRETTSLLVEEWKKLN